jgi:hypothetical protein
MYEVPSQLSLEIPSPRKEPALGSKASLSQISSRTVKHPRNAQPLLAYAFLHMQKLRRGANFCRGRGVEKVGGRQ